MGKGPKAQSNVEWRKWGEDDPFYGVATRAGRQRGGANPWTAADFYELGNSDWPDFRDHWTRYGVTFDRVVDIGCGAGRLTKFMASDFAAVVGVDVSEGMLKVARENVDDPRVEFRLGDGVTLPVDTASADGAFSAHVFQHLESLELARANFAEMARILKPGGSLMVHLPVMLPPTGLPGLRIALRARRTLSDLRAMVRRRRGTPLMRGLEYPWPWLSRELRLLGLVDIELLIFALRRNGRDHACVLARKAEA